MEVLNLKWYPVAYDHYFIWQLSVATYYRLVHRINPLNAELNPICHLLALLGTHLTLHVSRIRVNVAHSADFSHARGNIVG